jgi:hypothetical protein
MTENDKNADDRVNVSYTKDVGPGRPALGSAFASAEFLPTTEAQAATLLAQIVQQTRDRAEAALGEIDAYIEDIGRVTANILLINTNAENLRRQLQAMAESGHIVRMNARLTAVEDTLGEVRALWHDMNRGKRPVFGGVQPNWAYWRQSEAAIRLWDALDCDRIADERMIAAGAAVADVGTSAASALDDRIVAMARGDVPAADDPAMATIRDLATMPYPKSRKGEPDA